MDSRNNDNGKKAQEPFVTASYLADMMDAIRRQRSAADVMETSLRINAAETILRYARASGGSVKLEHDETFPLLDVYDRGYIEGVRRDVFDSDVMKALRIDSDDIGAWFEAVPFATGRDDSHMRKVYFDFVSTSSMVACAMLADPDFDFDECRRLGGDFA